MRHAARHLAAIAVETFATSIISGILGMAGGMLAFAGTNAARRVLERIDDRRFRAWTRWTMAGAGAAYLATGAAQLPGY
jgi:hypothetical protein